MAEITKQALKVDNNTSFPNNNAGAITPAILRAFNVNMIDSMVDEIGYNVDSASWNVSIDNIEAFSGSTNVSITNLNASSASQQVSINNINAFTASQQSFNASATASIVELLNLSSSLSGGFVTEGELAAATASLITQIDTKLNTSSFNAYTASTNTSITNLNASSASQQVSINALNVFTASQSTASLVTSITNLNTFSASALVSISNLNTTTASLNTSVTNINSATASLFTSASLALVTASFDTGTRNLTFTKGNTQTFSVNIPDVSGSAGDFVTTSSFNAYTSSNNQRVSSLEANSASVNTSITNINSTTASLNTSVTNINSTTASLNTSASLGLTTASVNVNIITFTKGNGTTFDIAVAASGSVAPGTISGSAQITALGFVSSSVTASSLVTASFSGNTLTFTKGDASTFGVVIPDVSGSAGTTVIEVVYTGESITKGDPLYISGSQGANPTVFKADAADPNKMPVTFISNETIGASNTTNAIVLGLIEGIDLTGYTAGQTIYVAEGGGYSTSLPSGSNSITQLLGVITKGGSGGKGLVLNPGPAQLPGLDTGYMWVGGATNQPVEITTASFATTGSNTFTGDQTLIDNAGNFFTISDASGSMMLVAKGFTSASAHMSASAAGIGNFIFKTNSNTADTIISGSGNIFANLTAPTAGFKRYIGGNNNIYNGTLAAQISGSMGFSPAMNTNIGPGTFIMRGPNSSSAWTISSNVIQGTINIGSSATFNAEKLTSGLTMTGNSVAGTLSIVANQSALTGSTPSITNNIIAGTATLNLSSSAASLANNIINDSNFTFTNQYYSGSLGVGTFAFNRNNIGGFGNTITISGSLPAGTSPANSISDNFIFGGANTIYVDVANARVSGGNPYVSVNRTGLMGNNLIVSASSLFTDTDTIGSVFVGRYNANDNIRNKTSDVVFAVGTGNSTTRKTGFLIDSGSNSYFEGTLNVSGSTSLNGNLVITGSLTASLQQGFVYVGNASGITTTVSTSSFISTINTGSFATTGSNSFNGNQTITGSVNISGSLTTAGNMFQVTGSFNTFGNVITQQGVFTSSLAGGLEIDGIGYVGSGSAGAFFINSTTKDIKIQNYYTSDGTTGKNIVIENFSPTGSGGIHGKVALRARGDGGAVTVENTSQFRVECNSEITGSLIVSSSLTASLQQGYAWVGNSSNVSSLVATSSFATNVSNLATTGSNSFNGNQTITGSLILSSSAAVELQVIGNSVFTGSVAGNVVSMSITSNTASMDLSLGNYFTLTLAGTATTHISASNVQPGVSATLVITTGTNSSASLAPTMLQPSGSAYSATAGSGKKDVLSIVAVSTGVPFVVSTLNMI